jgi:tRNA G18 (ribose-2'-O)-methylase SpoU
VPVVPITDLADPRLDDYRNVPDPELLHARGVFVAEGRHVVRRLLTSTRFTTRSLLVTETALASLSDMAVHFPDLPVFVIAQEAMNAVIGFNIHRGCLAIGHRPIRARWTEVVSDARRVLILERIANADNVGGIFRNAAALGADAVLLGPACTDPLYRKAIRTSMGGVLTVPFAELDDWPGDLETLRLLGFRLMALTPAADATPLSDYATRSIESRIALMLGHEGDGLSPQALGSADVRVRIPMAPGVDSVNVATAAAIALYELGS